MLSKLLVMNSILLHCVVSNTLLPPLPTLYYTDTGELYTWGKAGPHLGYSVSANKQLEPRLVDQLKGKMVKHVDCGYSHTIGKYFVSVCCV